MKRCTSETPTEDKLRKAWKDEKHHGEDAREWLWVSTDTEVVGGDRHEWRTSWGGGECHEREGAWKREAVVGRAQGGVKM